MYHRLLVLQFMVSKSVLWFSLFLFSRLPPATIRNTQSGIQCEIAMIPALVGFSISTFTVIFVIITSMLMT